MGFVCPECGEFRLTVNGVYWHLVIDHGMSRDQAYMVAGQAEFAERDDR